MLDTFLYYRQVFADDVIPSAKGFEPSKNILQWAKKNKGNISVSKDPIDAVSSADCVITDKWISMGDKISKKKKKKTLRLYQVKIGRASCRERV